MRNAVRQLAWFLVQLSAAPTSAVEPVRLPDGRYRFNGECYQAVVDLHGRLASVPQSPSFLPAEVPGRSAPLTPRESG